jgi:acetolactate decarboxylase
MQKSENLLYLCAPINALVEGIYKEKIPLREVKEYGDFGLGTFDDLDGEMVMLDGNAYQIPSDGHVKPVSDDALTPFAAVTFYNPLTSDRTGEPMKYKSFLSWLLRLLPSPNLLYALRIEGEFSHVRTRSVPKQECYVPLVEVTKNQPEFEFENIRGTLAGFYTPSFMASLSVPGLHLHFLSEDLQRGGHLLECDTISVQAGVQILDRLELSLPKSLEYLTWDLRRDISRDLEKAET